MLILDLFTGTIIILFSKFEVHRFVITHQFGVMHGVGEVPCLHKQGVAFGIKSCEHTRDLWNHHIFNFEVKLEENMNVNFHNTSLANAM